VLLDAPAVEVKVYTRHLEMRLGTRIDLSDDATALERRDDHATVCRLGDRVTIVLTGREKRGGAWKLALAD
jgi:hypothetical protein